MMLILKFHTTFRIIWPVHYFTFTPDTNLWHSFSPLYSHQTNRRPLPLVSPPTSNTLFSIFKPGVSTKSLVPSSQCGNTFKMKKKISKQHHFSEHLSGNTGLISGHSKCGEYMSHTLHWCSFMRRVCLLVSQNSDRLIDSKCGPLLPNKSKAAKKIWLNRHNENSIQLRFNRKLF